jgi:thiamine biosynthesis lipoprotein
VYNFDNGPVQGAKALLQQRLPQVDWSRVEVTDNGARILDSGMLINLDSCVRPYAVDSIRRIFENEGVRSALISLDEDVATIGKQPDGANWLVGVKHPKGTGVAIVRLKLNNRGYSIRGDFEKCLNMHNERFGRALSPIDGHPIPGLLCVGVMANTALEACGAVSVAQVKTEQQALSWLTKLDLPWFAIDRNLSCHGLLPNDS